MLTRDRTSELDEQVDEPHALEAGVEAQQGPGHEILALQRLIGNAQTARLLGGRGRSPMLSREVTGNPADLPASGDDAATTHAAPTIADAAGHRPPTSEPGGTSVSEMAIKPRATGAAPVIGDAVTEDQLFERAEIPAHPDSSPAVPSGFSLVTEQEGSIASPVVVEAADNSIFIDPGPKADDVMQGMLGDCYDLSTVIQIANRDPGKIRSIMSPDGSGGASVTLYHRIEVPPPAGAAGPPSLAYAPETVVASSELAFDVDPAAGPAVDIRAARAMANGQPYGHLLHGARLLAAPAPKEHRWAVEVDDQKLRIVRLDVFQMARWAPLLEKAGSRFSEQYGQYGHSGKSPDEGEATGASGYSNLGGGGFAGYTLTLFYGKDGEMVPGGQGDSSATAWAPAMAGTSAVLVANQAAFDRVLLLSGRGSSAAADPRAATTPLVTAGTEGVDTYAPRAHDAIPAAMADPDWSNVHAHAKGDVATVQHAIDSWTAATPDLPDGTAGPPAPNSKSVTAQALTTAANNAIDPARNPTLISSDRSAPIQALRDLLLILKQVDDHASGSRSVFPDHEYSVLAVTIVNNSSAPAGFDIAAVPPADRPAKYGFVNVSGSSVTVMNPHHQSVPDPTGTSRDRTGVFNLPLDQFFMLFSGVTSAEVTPTR